MVLTRPDDIAIATATAGSRARTVKAINAVVLSAASSEASATPH